MYGFFFCTLLVAGLRLGGQDPVHEEYDYAADASGQSAAIAAATDLSAITDALEGPHSADAVGACNMCFYGFTKEHLHNRCTMCISVPLETPQDDGSNPVLHHFACLPGTQGAIGYVREKEGCVCAKETIPVTGGEQVVCNAP
jgi:hypothetical protein